MEQVYAQQPVVEQQQNQENQTLNLDFNPPEVEDVQNQRNMVNEPENYIRAVPDNQEEQTEINNEVHQLLLNEINKKIDDFRLTMQTSRLKNIEAKGRKNFLENLITGTIKKDLEDKNISKNEVQNAIDIKVISELARLGYDENGEKIIDLNESTISLRSEIPQKTQRPNDSFANIKIETVLKVLKRYLANTNPPETYKDMLPELSPKERILKIKEFYKERAKKVSNYEILPMKDYENAIEQQTNATLETWGYDANGLKKNLQSKKRKRPLV